MKTTVTAQCGRCDGYDVEVDAPDTDPAAALRILNAAADAHRAWHEANPGPVHIRRQIARKRGDTFYKVKYSAGEDGSQTLCGAPAGNDISYGDARHAKYLAHVTCDRCKQIRAQQPTGRK